MLMLTKARTKWEYKKMGFTDQSFPMNECFTIIHQYLEILSDVSYI